jgi:hypothetical protein
MNPYRNNDFRAFLDSIPLSEIERQNRLQTEENEKVHNEFIEGLKVGKCFLCGGQMDSFDVNKPCFHWFTYPSGIKKKYFESYLEKTIGFFQLDSYFRWLANTEKPIGNINDLKDETSTTSYLETTYKYKDIEWAFSIGHTDKEGHPNSMVGSKPHYHIQMKVGGRVFLKFNDFHIPFPDSDLFMVEMFEQAADRVQIAHSYGYGAGIIEDDEILKNIDDVLKVSDDAENAVFNREIMIVARDGNKIPDRMIKIAYEESKSTKQSVAKIMQRLLDEANISADIISTLYPTSRVPEMAKRSGKK